MKKYFLNAFTVCALALSVTPVFADDDAATTTTTQETSAAQNATHLSVEKILKELKEQGYLIVYKVKLNDNVYEVKAMDVQGRGINLKFDAATGKMINSEDAKKTPAMSMFDAVKKVKSAGYKNIIYIENDDDNFKVTVLDKDNKKEDLVIDTQKGTVEKD